LGGLEFLRTSTLPCLLAQDKFYFNMLIMWKSLQVPVFKSGRKDLAGCSGPRTNGGVCRKTYKRLVKAHSCTRITRNRTRIRLCMIMPCHAALALQRITVEGDRLCHELRCRCKRRSVERFRFGRGFPWSTGKSRDFARTGSNTRGVERFKRQRHQHI